MASTNSKTRSSRRLDTRKLFLWLDQVRSDPELSPSAFKVAYEIGQHFNSRHGGAAWPSSQTIATNIGVGKATVIRVVRQLRERGHLKIDPGKAGRGYSNKYFLILKKGAAHLKPPAKTCTGAGFQDANKRSTSGPFAEQIKGPFSTLKGPPVDLNYLEPPMGTLSAFPIEERERSRALAVIPASAPAPVGGALEQGKEAVDRFPELWALWSSSRSWPDGNLDEFLARRSFDLACREAPPNEIIACAQAWVSAVAPRYLSTLSKWLLGRGWTKQPPARRQRNGGKIALSPLTFDVASQMERS